MNKSIVIEIVAVFALALTAAVPARAQSEIDATSSPEERTNAFDSTSDDSSTEPTEEIAYDPVEKRANLGMVFGLKLGGNFSGVFSDLGTSFVTELEIGYLLPLPRPIDRSIEVFVTGQYTQPTTKGTIAVADKRFASDGLPKYEITQRQAILTLGALYRVPVGGSLGKWLRPYAALGGRVYLMQTQVDGSVAEESFGTNNETATKGGVYGALGADGFVGPGAAFLEMQITYAGLDGYIMRDTNVGAINLAVGYRLFI